MSSAEAQERAEAPKPTVPVQVKAQHVLFFGSRSFAPHILKIRQGWSLKSGQCSVEYPQSPTETRRALQALSQTRSIDQKTIVVVYQCGSFWAHIRKGVRVPKIHSDIEVPLGADEELLQRVIDFVELAFEGRPVS